VDIETVVVGIPCPFIGHGVTKEMHGGTEVGATAQGASPIAIMALRLDWCGAVVLALVTKISPFEHEILKFAVYVPPYGFLVHIDIYIKLLYRIQAL